MSEPNRRTTQRKESNANALFRWTWLNVNGQTCGVIDGFADKCSGQNKKTIRSIQVFTMIRNLNREMFLLSIIKVAICNLIECSSSLLCCRSCMNWPEKPDVADGCLYSNINAEFEFVISMFAAHIRCMFEMSLG